MSKSYSVDPWFEGYNAYMNGLSRSKNPYSSKHGMLWARGWMAAYREDTDQGAFELPTLKRA